MCNYVAYNRFYKLRFLHLLLFINSYYYRSFNIVDLFVIYGRLQNFAIAPSTGFSNVEWPLQRLMTNSLLK